MSRATLQAAFILHHRPFRDTSVIADLITPDHGLVSVIARGARSATSRRRVLLQPFRPLLASWTGRSELRTLTTLEESGLPIALSGEPLACAYYVSELALRLLPKGEPNVEVFALYARTLSELSDGVSRNSETSLRLFELDLLDSLGLLPDFAHCDKDHGEILADIEYQFHPLSGTATRAAVALDSVAVSGATLLAMQQRQLPDADQPGSAVSLPQAKRVMRAILRTHLGNQPLKSREVFRQLRALSPQNEPGQSQPFGGDSTKNRSE